MVPRLGQVRRDLGGVEGKETTVRIELYEKKHTPIFNKRGKVNKK